MSTANTITNISYTGTTQTGNVAATYGIPVTAHIWGAGGGSSSLYPGAGGGYSRVNFVAKPGDVLTVAVGQGGGAGGVTAPPPPPATVWSTRSGGYSGTTLYPTPNYAFYKTPVTATYGVWSNPGGDGYLTQVNDTWELVTFPITGYYTIQGGAVFTGPFYEPYPGTLSIDGVAVMNLPSNQAGDQQAKVWIAAGTHSISVSASGSRPRLASSVICSSVGFVISQANPPNITSTPTGLPGASYIALLFNTRFPPPNQAALVYAVGNGDSFLDQWGVWEADQNTNSFYRQYSVYFPATANVIFQMSCNNTGTLLLDGDVILSRTAVDNPNTPSQVIISVPAGNHNVVISATGTVGGVNRVGVTFGTGDQTSYSGGRGGISDPTSKQGFGGGGGGATILSINGVVIGVGAGGGGGAGAAPTNIVYITTKYIGSLSTQPFVNTPCGSVITPGTSGYYVYGTIHYDGAIEGQVGQFNPYLWCVVVNGVIVYGPASAPPPENTAQATQFVGWSCYDPLSQYNDFPAVECFSFDYTAVNTGAITDAKFNGQNGQDEFNFNTTDTGGGGGGGGGARGGNGGSARGSGGGGTSGHNGMSLGGSAVFPPTGRLPYTNEYYPSGDIAGFNFDTATATPTNGSRLPYRNPSSPWQPWMLQHAVCFSANPIEYSVNFPVAGTYIFNMGADYSMTVSVDGVAVASLSDYGGSWVPPSPREFSVSVTAGLHTISIAWYDDGGTAGFALTIAIPGSVGIAQGGQVGVATNGGNGYIVLEYQTGGGMSVKDSGEWKPVQTIYIKDEGTWKEVQTTYINQDGIWTPVKGAAAPAFTSVNGAFGALVRPSTAGNLTYVAPPPPAPDYSNTGYCGWGDTSMF